MFMTDAKDLLKNCKCPWCGEAGLKIVEAMETAPNGAARITAVGWKVVCAAPLSGCPNTTGLCRSALEAATYAHDDCVEMGTAG